MTDVHQDELRLRLTEAMDLHGLTQNAVSRQCGVNQSSISQFVRGGTMHDENAQKMTEFLRDLGEPGVPTSDEARRAIRLYRYLQALTDQGATLTVRFADGSENALLVLW